MHDEPSIILDQTRDNGYKRAPIIDTIKVKCQHIPHSSAKWQRRNTTKPADDGVDESETYVRDDREEIEWADELIGESFQHINAEMHAAIVANEMVRRRTDTD